MPILGLGLGPILPQMQMASPQVHKMPLIIPRRGIRLPRVARARVRNLTGRSKKRHLIARLDLRNLSRLSRVSESRTARINLLITVVNLLVSLDQRLDPPPGVIQPLLLLAKPLRRGIPAACHPRMMRRTLMVIRVGGVAVVAATAKKKAQKVRNPGRGNLLMLPACLTFEMRATAFCE
jgi:hypothetical protein